MAQPFRFKQFNVSDDRCSMKVGTDAVLLGAWADISGASTILDIGGGSGVISLMMAQRTPAETHIDSVEISENDYQQATENVNISPWREKITVHHMAIQDYEAPAKYDLIISNPPFFINSLLPPSIERTQARHDSGLTQDDLLDSVVRLLSPRGKFAIILPTVEGNQFTLKLEKAGLFPVRQLAVHSRNSKLQERWLLEFYYHKQTTVIDKLVIHEKGDEWTEEYKNLTRDFYLRL